VSEAIAVETQTPSASGPGIAGASPSIYKRDFWLVFAATFALNTAGNLFVLFPLFIVHLGGGATTIGKVIATGSAAALLSRPIAPALIDRRGRRWTALRFLAVNAIGFALYIPIHGLGWPIYAVMALLGVANGTARVALFAMVYDILPAGRQGEGMATFSMCGMMPASFAPLVGELILKRLGFSAFFLSAALACAVAVGAVMMLADDGARAARTQSPSGPRASYRDLIFAPSLLTFWVVTLLAAMAISSRPSFVAPFAHAQGVKNVGWYFALYSIVAVAVRMRGRLMDRVGFERVLAPSLVILSIGLGLISLTGTGGMLYVAAVVGGLGHGFAYPAISAIVIRNTPAGEMGRASTVYTSVWDISGMAGPYMLGLTAHYLGYAPMFIVAGGLAFSAVVYLVLAAPHTLRRRLA